MGREKLGGGGGGGAEMFAFWSAYRNKGTKFSGKNCSKGIVDCEILLTYFMLLNLFTQSFPPT